jgi:TonB family protein
MKILTLTFFLLSFALSSAAQITPEPRWTTIVSDNGDLSFSVPSDFLVHKDNERDQISLRAGLDDTSFRITLEKAWAGKETLKGVSKNLDDPPAKVTQAALGKFDIATYEFEKNTFDLAIYLASSSRYYSLRISSRTRDDKTVQKFLQSILLDKSPLFKSEGTGPDTTEKTVSTKDLKTTELVAEVLKRKPTEKKDIKLTSIANDGGTIDRNFYSRPLWILQKPMAPYTDDARQRNIQGKVVLFVEFKASGDVGDIRVVKGLAGGLTENVARAVKQIKFLPAEIDGKPVDSFRLLQYGFSIY